MYDIVEVTDESFEQEVLEFKESPVLVDFWADWCPPCKAMTPRFESVALEYGDRVRFAKADIDVTADFAGKLGVLSIPCFVLFEDGVPKARYVGALGVKEFGEWLEENIVTTTNPN